MAVNGVAKEANRTIIERMRCMLIDSGLNKEFWAEATNTACFLINRVVKKRNAVLRRTHRLIGRR